MLEGHYQVTTECMLSLHIPDRGYKDHLTQEMLGYIMLHGGDEVLEEMNSAAKPKAS